MTAYQRRKGNPDCRNYHRGYAAGRQAWQAGAPVPAPPGENAPVYDQGFYAGYTAAEYGQLPLEELLTRAAALNPASLHPRNLRRPAPLVDDASLERYWEGYEEGVTTRRAGDAVPPLPAETDPYTSGFRAGYALRVEPLPWRSSYPVWLDVADLSALGDWTERCAEREALAEIAAVERLLGSGDWARAARTRIYYGGGDD